MPSLKQFVSWNKLWLCLNSISFHYCLELWREMSWIANDSCFSAKKLRKINLIITSSTKAEPSSSRVCDESDKQLIGVDKGWLLESILWVIHLVPSSENDLWSSFDWTNNTMASRVTGGFPSQRASNAENMSIWCRHHVIQSSFGLTQRYIDISLKLCNMFLSQCSQAHVNRTSKSSFVFRTQVGPMLAPWSRLRITMAIWPDHCEIKPVQSCFNPFIIKLNISTEGNDLHR